MTIASESLLYEKGFGYEHILLHDFFAKGLGTSSENLERPLLVKRA